MQKRVNLIIAGTRTFTDYKLVCTVMELIRKKYPNIQIVVGGAKGADSCGKLYALKNKIPYVVYEAEVEKNGKKSDSIKREKMIKVSQVLVLFWDGVSSESEDMLHLAVQYELNCFVMLYKTNEFFAGQNVIDNIYDKMLPF